MILISINYSNYLNIFSVDFLLWIISLWIAFPLWICFFLSPTPVPFSSLYYSYRKQNSLKENRFIGKIQNSSKEKLNNEALGLEPIASWLISRYSQVWMTCLWSPSLLKITVSGRMCRRTPVSSPLSRSPGPQGWGAPSRGAAAEGWRWDVGQGSLSLPSSLSLSLRFHPHSQT